MACKPVADLPDGGLSSSAAARLWGQDRAALGECRRRHASLVGALKAVEEQSGP
ncbi:hypothetical protein [Shinella sp.]|uniref:hypothetical protein n=1 Tax=Shinella sp. TaxID=1870904 RepID=UPI0029BB81F9|nr:hypothetical protein [Shinella sp.]MDX3973317.1 hypothetical protein [Shinella sp.]